VKFLEGEAPVKPFVMRVCVLVFACLTGMAMCRADELAAVTGLITDPNGRSVPGVTVLITNLATNVASRTVTNDQGIYRVPSLQPGIYRMTVDKDGFKSIVKSGIELHVQDVASINFELQIGSVNETVTVEAGASMINTTDAAVSTVVDQTYVKNMPLNGRSFQDLILLTPGVVTQTSQSAANFNAGLGRTGEFSVNGQRAESNSYTVDGVSVNVGATSGSSMYSGAGVSGSVPAATALGTTQALVSVDDLQEFRVQSSTYSAAYGRTPGGQFAFETKSGTNQSHGSLYNYLRNNYFDANDWFNDYLGVPAPPLRQNDFGGTLGRAVRVPHLYNGKDKTFFFVSYEGLRLVQPQPASVSHVPNLCLRGTATACAGGNASAPAAVQPLLNAFPKPNGRDLGNGWAEYIASWSNPSSINSTSVRFDHVFTDKLRVFFRFSNTESSSASRGTEQGGSGFTPSMKTVSAYTMRTYTSGATSVLTNRLSNEFRLNYSSNEASASSFFDAIGGSTPVNLAMLTGLDSASTVQIFLCYGNFCIQPLQGLSPGIQRQWNLVDTANYSLGSHQLKFGADYRRLAPFALQSTPYVAYFYGLINGENDIETNNALAFAQSFGPAYPLYKNFSSFAQDEWRMSKRLTLSMGLRWEVNPAPDVTKGVMPYTIQGSNPDTWSLAPQGTRLWNTSWYNFAPRLGVAYVVRDAIAWEMVIRGGGGLFFDTGQQLGSVGFNGPGFLANGDFNPNGTAFPTLPDIPASTNPPTCCPYLSPPVFFPTHLQLPYTLQWNVSLEQGLGRSQALTFSYVGAHAARLLRNSFLNTPNNPNASQFELIENGLTSDYQSAQVQFRRRLSRGLTSLASYTWSHCLDYGSQNYNFGYTRGKCDFDVRHNFSGAFSYDIPNAGHGGVVSALLHNWGLDDRFIARTGFPITLEGGNYLDPVTRKQLPAGLDLVVNQPTYLYGANCTQVFQATLMPGHGCPGGRAINPNAFAPVPTDPTSNMPLRAGTAPRNFVRGFGAWQMNLAVRREFPMYERLKLQFRAEAFNVFNHPNFGVISTLYCSPNPSNSNFSSGCQFGQPTGTLASSLGVLAPLYQMGGPRSMQFALKLVF